MEKSPKKQGSGCNCEYCKTSTQGHVREALATRNFHEHPLENRVKPRACGTIRSVHERHSYARKKTSVRKEKHQNSHNRNFLRAKTRDKVPSLNVIQTGSKHRRFPNSLRARHGTCELHKELFMLKGHHDDVHSSNFFRCYVSTEAKNTASVLSIHSKEGMYMVNSDVSLQRMGLSSLKFKEKKFILKTLVIQHCGLRHVSKDLHQRA